MVQKLRKTVLCLVFLVCHLGVIYSESICNGGHGALVPDPKSCSSFYQCVWGNPVKNTCGTGLYFDNVLKVCNWPHMVSCSGPQTLIKSSNAYPYKPYNSNPFFAFNPCHGKKNGDLVPDHHSKTNYNICFWGNPMLMRCNFGFLFDPIYKACISIPITPPFPKLLITVTTPTNLLNSTPENKCKFQHGILLPDPESCTSFYECSWGNPKKIECLPGLHFDVKLSLCNSPNLAECSIGKITATTKSSIPTTMTENDICSPDDIDQFVNDPKDCRKYYKCDNGIAEHFTCPQDWYFTSTLVGCFTQNFSECKIDDND